MVFVKLWWEVHPHKESSDNSLNSFITNTNSRKVSFWDGEYSARAGNKLSLKTTFIWLADTNR